MGTKAKLEVRSGKVKKVRRQTELEEQAVLIEWADNTVIDGIRIGEYLIHIPNEGKCRPKAAKDAKRLGLRAGVPDLFLALPKGEFGGVWIEMKAPTGKPSVLQRKWMKKLTTVGYRVIIAYSFNDAQSVIKKYIYQRGK